MRLLIIFLFSTGVYAQTMISGIVMDNKGKAVPGANIFIKDSYDGTTSDADGNFSFTTIEKGEKILSVSFIGFEKWEQKINLDTAEIKMRVKLKEAVSELKMVTIAAGAFEASDEKKMVILRPLDIVTTAGASGDIYGALQTLPGTGVVGEKEGLFVRGGDASETKTFIDGLPVDNPYFSSVPDVPQRGRFSPFLFKGTSFSTGGYSAQYGQAMSSALILESQDLPEQSMTNLGIMSVGINIGHTKKWKKSSVGVYGGYTDLQPYFAISNQNRDWSRAPKALNGSVILRHKTSETGIIKAFVSYTWSDLAVMFPDTSDPALLRNLKFSNRNNNVFSSLSYKEIIFKSWTLYVATSFSTNADEIKIDEFPVTHSNDYFGSRIALSHALNEHSIIRFGGELQKPVENTEVPNYMEETAETYTAGFAEADIYITPKLVTRLGFRSENSKLLGKTTISPRVSIAYKTGEFSQFSFAYGDFYQSPPNNIISDYQNVGFDFEKSTHYILNFQHISDKRTFRIETYYKDYTDLIKFSNASADNSGYGHARGFDVFYRDKKTIPRSDFWISYSFLDTKRNYRDFIAEATPNFAASNTASLVFKHFIPKISFAPSITYVYSSGRTYFNPNNSVYLGDKTKDYHNLSLNFSYLTSIGKSFTVLVFSINNVLGVENVFAYRYSADGLRRIAVGPTANRFFFAAVFINIGSGKDDSEKYN